MSTLARAEKGAKIVTRIAAELMRAIALQAMWERCANREDVLYAFGRDEVDAGFRVVRDSLHIDLIMTLMRLYDGAKSDAASIPAAIEILADVSVQAHLFTLPGRQEAIAESLRLHDASAHDAVKALRALRDKVLAHNDRNKFQIEARYGDETRLLQASVALTSAMDRAFRGQSAQLAEVGAFWNVMANNFWGQITNSLLHLSGPVVLPASTLEE